MADELRKDHGIDVQLKEGGKGEFTVLADGREVAHKEGDNLPPLEQVLAAVKKARPMAAGTR